MSNTELQQCIDMIWGFYDEKSVTPTIFFSFFFFSFIDSVVFSGTLLQTLAFGIGVGLPLTGFHYHVLTSILQCLDWILEGSGTSPGSDALSASPGDIPGLKHTISQNSKVYALRICNLTHTMHTMPFTKVSTIFLRNLNIFVGSVWQIWSIQRYNLWYEATHSIFEAQLRRSKWVEMRCHFGRSQGVWKFKVGKKVYRVIAALLSTQTKPQKIFPHFFPLYLSSESTEQYRWFLFFYQGVSLPAPDLFPLIFTTAILWMILIVLMQRTPSLLLSIFSYS